jgi:UDP-hydrolysing UDP-N-acetyl-D-glucosamine 2-epimerase
LKKRTVAIYTGSRAEYGLLLSVLQAIGECPKLEYFLIVSGSHLEQDFGKTIDEIHMNGFKIGAKIYIKNHNKHDSTSRAIGLNTIEISKILEEKKPDILLVYGDRFESFSAVIASTQISIPTAHIEGGDLTEGGALDDSVRHAMTKLSHLHFTTNQQSTNRLLGMGEEAWRVHTVGLPSIDLISKGKFAKAGEVLRKLNLDASRPIVVFTQHSVTTEPEKVMFQLEQSLIALVEVALIGAQVVITYPNDDVGGRQIIEHLVNFQTKKVPNIQVHKSLGQSLYHGLLALALIDEYRIACVGNSSSGIKETPAFGCPTVDIGTRQQGRLRGENVISVDYKKLDITNAIKRCLFDDNFRHICRKSDNPYWLGNAGTKIAKVLAKVNLDQKLIRKKMTLKGIVQGEWHK